MKDFSFQNRAQKKKKFFCNECRSKKNKEYYVKNRNRLRARSRAKYQKRRRKKMEDQSSTLHSLEKEVHKLQANIAEMSARVKALNDSIILKNKEMQHLLHKRKKIRITNI